MLVSPSAVVVEIHILSLYSSSRYGRLVTVVNIFSEIYMNCF